jgi:hypothetical protein
MSVEIRLVLSDEFVSRFLDPAMRRDQRERMKDDILNIVLRTLTGNNALACYSLNDDHLKELRNGQIEKSPAE